jgi:hypothetical protein
MSAAWPVATVRTNAADRFKQGRRLPPNNEAEITLLGIAEQVHKRDIDTVFSTHGLAGFRAAATDPLSLFAACIFSLLRSEIPHGHHHRRKT